MVPEKHLIDPAFAEGMKKVRDRYFCDAKLWPVFADPVLASIVRERRRHMPRSERVGAYPDGAKLVELLRSTSRVPERMAGPDDPDRLLPFTAALSKNWEDPASVENVITTPSDPAIFGTMVGTLANANLVYAEYAELATELESLVIRQLANLVGYDPAKAAGIFTAGGTFCNLYGYLLGIRKSLPMAREYGLEHGQDYRIINSQGGHYSNTTNLSLLGVNLRKKTIRIRLSEHNDMDLEDLERQLRACFQLDCTVPTIMLTMGTTDTFGVDRVKPVADIRDRLCAEFEIKVKPHIHVDSAIGWPLIYFLDYDFQTNPLKINHATLPGLRRNVDRFRELRYADSFTVDFQKWGYVPYTSSLVMIRDGADIAAMEHDPENFGYFDEDTEGHTHLHATVECSRSAAGVFGAYTAMRYLGLEGYRRLVANSLQNANYFRFRLSCLPGVKVTAAQNQGPSVAFRVYDPELVSDPDAEFGLELHALESAEAKDRLERNSKIHREMFRKRGKIGLYTNWIESLALTAYDHRGRYGRIPGEKAVFLNPHTSYADIDLFISHLRA